jgi:phage gp29-like protein
VSGRVGNWSTRAGQAHDAAVAKRPPTRGFRDLPVFSQFRIHEKVEDFYAILREHDYGNFRRSAALVDEILTDDRISGVFEQRTAALKAAPLVFVAANERRAAQRLADDVGGVDRQTGLWRYIASSEAQDQLLTWGLMLGFGYARIHVEREAKRWLPQLQVWHPQWVRWDHWTRRFVAQTEDRGEVPLPRPDLQPRGDGEWFVYCPYGAQYGWTRGLIRSLGLKYTSRSWNEMSFDRYVERQGMAILKGKVPSTANADEKSAFANQLGNVGSEPAVILPQGEKEGTGYDVDKVEFDARTWESMTDRKHELDEDIAIRVLGQNLTTKGDGKGSYALGKVHDLIRLDKAIADAEIGPAIRAQVLTWWAEWNYGDPELAPWPTYEVAPPDDDLGEANVLKALGEGLLALVAAEPRVDVLAILEEAGVPLISEEDFEAAKEVELAAGGPAAGGGAQITPSAQAAIMTVNEARALIRLGPMLGDGGAPDPDGELTIAEFQAKYAETVGKAAQAEAGANQVGDETNPPAPGGEPLEDETKRPSSETAALSAVGGSKPRMARALGALFGGFGGVRKRYEFCGLPIAIENPIGSIRLWTDETGRQGATRMACDYGFIEGYKSGDDEELDVYIGPDPEPRDVFVIHQRKAPDYRAHDEDKVMLGFVSLEAARAAFLAHRDDGERAIGTVSVIPLEIFKARLRRRGAETTTKIHASLVEGDLLRMARAGTGRVAFRRAVAGPRRAAKYDEILLERSKRAAARLLGPRLKELQAELEKMDSLEELRARLPRLLKGWDPAALGDVLRRTNVLAQLAGQASAQAEVRPRRRRR